MATSLLRCAAVLALAALVPTAAAARVHRRHHHRPPEPPPAEAMVPTRPAPSLQDRAAEQSGFAFGLLDLGISGTPTAISPYVRGDYGYVRSGN